MRDCFQLKAFQNQIVGGGSIWVRAPIDLCAYEDLIQPMACVSVSGINLFQIPKLPGLVTHHAMSINRMMKTLINLEMLRMWQALLAEERRERLLLALAAAHLDDLLSEVKPRRYRKRSHLVLRRASPRTHLKSNPSDGAYLQVLNGSISDRSTSDRSTSDRSTIDLGSI